MYYVIRLARYASIDLVYYIQIFEGERDKGSRIIADDPGEREPGREEGGEKSARFRALSRSPIPIPISTHHARHVGFRSR